MASGCSWSALGRFFVDFGSILGLFWVDLGSILYAFGRHLGRRLLFSVWYCRLKFFVAFAYFHFLRLLSDAFVCYYTALLLLLATLVCCLLLFAALSNPEQPRATESNCLHALSVPCFSGSNSK